MDTFGLDIGSRMIKVIQLASKGEKYQLVAFGSVPSVSKGLASEAESDLITLAEAIKKLHQDAKIKTPNAVVALPQDKVFTQVITLPQLSEKELDSALKWEAEQYIPFPLEEVTLSRQIVGQVKEGGKEKIELLLAAAQNRLIEKLTKVLKAAGLNPVSLEMEIMAIARSLVSPDSEPVMIVDLGATATDLGIVEAGQVVFIHSFPTGGEALTRAITFELGLDPTQAEAYKKAYGADPKKLEGKIKQAISPVLEVMVKEIEKALQFYQAKQKVVKQIILAGGTAGLPEMASLLAEKLSLEIQIGNAFSRLVEDNLVSQIPSNETPLYVVAVGLALKEMS